jgi:hypothetical protein
MKSLLTVSSVLLCAASAFADTPEASLQAQTTGENQHQIRATLIGAPKLPAAKLTLADGATKLHATQVTTYAASNETLALAVVLDTDEGWITPRLPALAKAIDATNLAKLCPPDSFVTLITYATDVQTRVAMGPMNRLTGKALGTAADYKGHKGAAMSTAVTMALAEVGKVKSVKKAVIVIGDGTDWDAKAPLAELAKQAAAHDIQLYAAVSATGAITKLVPTPATADPAKDLGTIVKRLVDRTYAIFPAKDLAWDGKSHDLTLTLDKTALAPIPLVLH